MDTAQDNAGKWRTVIHQNSKKKIQFTCLCSITVLIIKVNKSLQVLIILILGSSFANINTAESSFLKGHFIQTTANIYEAF